MNYGSIGPYKDIRRFLESRSNAELMSTLNGFVHMLTVVHRGAYPQVNQGVYPDSLDRWRPVNDVVHATAQVLTILSNPAGTKPDREVLLEKIEVAGEGKGKGYLHAIIGRRLAILRSKSSDEPKN